MPSIPNPGPGNTWPEAPENRPVPQDDDRRTEVAGAPAGSPHAPETVPPEPGTSPIPPGETGATHRPPLSLGEIPASWLPVQPAQPAQSPENEHPESSRDNPQPDTQNDAVNPDAPGRSSPDQTSPEQSSDHGTASDGPGTSASPSPAEPKPNASAQAVSPPGQTPSAQHQDGANEPGAPWPGQHPTGQPSPGQYPPGQFPPGQSPAGQYPPGPYPPGQFPAGQFTPDQHPAGQHPSGQFPPDQHLAGQSSPGQFPPGQYPLGGPEQSGPPSPQGPHGQPGWHLPEAKRKSPEELKASVLRTRDRLRLFIVMVIGLLIVSELALPFRLAGIGLGLAAGFVGVKVLIGLAEMRRAGLGARGVVFTVFGLGLSGMLLFVLVTQAVYYPVVADLEECQERAITTSAAETCVDETNARFENILENMNQRIRN
ncbi:hypothetical protein [Kineosporia babensis]|uniref:DUF4190 domain-containing protein n=1 Tax=Kineosporia babensis TaxID=499548 RepID=A0A9X1NGM7_9ACTN|nr:hypothetical protein [Kineosporia babensis]MCD5313530.1 hypothetical protein [Kineosporia babensis]